MKINFGVKKIFIFSVVFIINIFGLNLYAHVYYHGDYYGLKFYLEDANFIHGPEIYLDYLNWPKPYFEAPGDKDKHTMIDNYYNDDLSRSDISGKDDNNWIFGVYNNEYSTNEKIYALAVAGGTVSGIIVAIGGLFSPMGVAAGAAAGSGVYIGIIEAFRKGGDFIREIACKTKAKRIIVSCSDSSRNKGNAADDYFGAFGFYSCEQKEVAIDEKVIVRERVLEASSGEFYDFAPLYFGNPIAAGRFRGSQSFFNMEKGGIEILSNCRAKKSISDDGIERIDDEKMLSNRLKFKDDYKIKYHSAPPTKYALDEFKMYAGLAFYIQTRVTIKNKATISGYYGIAASEPVHNEKYSSESNRCRSGIIGTIENSGIIEGVKAAIDVSNSNNILSIGYRGGSKNFNGEKDSLTIKNKAKSDIKGSIIFSKFQISYLNNYGSIEKYNEGIDHIITGDNLTVNNHSYIRSSSITGSNLIINNSNTIAVEKALVAKKIINSGNLLCYDDFSVTNTINNGLLDLSSLDKINDNKLFQITSIINNSSAELRMDNVDLEEPITNYGMLKSMNTIYSRNYTNNARISTGTLTGAKTHRSATDTFTNQGVLLPKIIDVLVTNKASGIISNNNAMLVKKYLTNNGTIECNQLILKASLENNNLVNITDNIATDKGFSLINNEELRHSGEKFYYKGFNFQNNKLVNIQSRLILETILTTEGTYFIKNLVSNNINSQLVNSNSSNSITIDRMFDCYVNNQIKRNNITINKVLGNAHIDYLSLIDNIKIREPGTLTVDTMESDFAHSINNSCCLIVKKLATIYGRNIVNNSQGNIIIEGKLVVKDNPDVLEANKIKNLGRFVINDIDTSEDYEFYNDHENANLIFNKATTSNLKITNYGWLKIIKSVEIASYQGLSNDKIKLYYVADHDKSKAYLSAQKNINVFSEGAISAGKAKTKIIISRSKAGNNFKKIENQILIKAAELNGFINMQTKQLKHIFFGYKSELPSLSDGYQQTFLVRKARIETEDDIEKLMVDFDIVNVPTYYFPQSDDIYYSMQHITDFLDGVVNLGSGGNFKVHCDAAGKHYYAEGSKLFIGKSASNQNLANIVVETNDATDTLAIISQYKNVSIGNIKIEANINGSNGSINANGLVLRTKEDTRSNYLMHRKIDSHIWILDNFSIEKQVELTAATGKSALEICCLVEGDLINNGIINSSNGNAINILGPLNYWHGKIINNGNIIADKLALNTNLTARYEDKTRLFKLINHNMMQGGIVLSGLNSSIINYGTLDTLEEGITVKFAENITIENSGELDISKISINKGKSSINLFNIGRTVISEEAVFNKIENTGTLISADNLSVLTSFVNSGTIEVNTLNISENYKNDRHDLIIENKTEFKNSNYIHLKEDLVVKNSFVNNGYISLDSNLIIATSNFKNYGEVKTTKDIIADVNYFSNNGILKANKLHIKNTINLDSGSEVIVSNIEGTYTNNLYLTGDGILRLGKLGEESTFNNQVDINLTNYTYGLKFYTNKININRNFALNQTKMKFSHKVKEFHMMINSEANVDLTWQNLDNNKLNIFNRGTLQLLSPATISGYNGVSDSVLELKLPVLIEKNVKLDKPLLTVINQATFDFNSSVIKIIPQGIILQDKSYNIKVVVANKLVDNIGETTYYNRILLDKIDTNSILLNVKNIKIENNSINAIIELQDKELLGLNTIRKAYQTLLASNLGKNCQKQDEDITALGYIKRTKPTNTSNATKTSRYSTTAYVALSPRELYTNYDCSLNAQDLIIKSASTGTQELLSDLSKPVLVIGNAIKADDFFITSATKEFTLNKISIEDIYICGNKDNGGSRADSDGIVLNGSNKLILKSGMSLNENVNIIPGPSRHALHIGSYIEGTITNSGVIGSKHAHCGVYFSQPMEGTLTNKNIIQGSSYAIKISLLNNWKPQAKYGLAIVNDKKIYGNIFLEKGEGTKAVNIINNNEIVADSINSSSQLIVHNNKTGNISVNKSLALDQHFINDGILKVNELSLLTNCTSDGTIKATKLDGKNNTLNAKELSVHHLKNILLSGTNLSVSSKVSGEVTVTSVLGLTNIVQQQGNLTVKELDFKQYIVNRISKDSHIINTGKINITSNKTIGLNDHYYTNSGIIEVDNIVELSGNFTTSGTGKLITTMLELDGHNINFTDSATLVCQYLSNKNKNVSTLYLSDDSNFKLGILSTPATIEGDIRLSKQTADFKGAREYNADILFKQHVTCASGDLFLGSIKTDNNPVNFTIKPQANVKLNRSLAKNKLSIINHGTLGIIANSNLSSYIGEKNSHLELTLGADTTNFADNFLTVTDKITFTENTTLTLEPFKNANNSDYTQICLFQAPSKQLFYIDGTGNEVSLTLSRLDGLITKVANNNRIIRLGKIEVKDTSYYSIVYAMISIKDITNFPAELKYLDQKIVYRFNNRPTITNIIEGIAWRINKSANHFAANNLIISPPSLVDKYQIAKYDFNTNTLNIESTNANDNIPNLVIGTEVFSRDITEKVENPTNNKLLLNNINVNNMVINSGIKNNSDLIMLDAMLITGTYTLELTGTMTLNKKTVLIANNFQSALHIDASFIGNINNYGTIGTRDIPQALGIKVSNNFSGTITNYGKIIGRLAAFMCTPTVALTTHKKIKIINNKKIVGSIFHYNKNIELDIENHANIIGTTIIAYGSSTLTNLSHSSILLSEDIILNKLDNKGIISIGGCKLNKLINNNTGILIVSGTKVVTANDKNFSNKGFFYARNIGITGTFTNEGIITPDIVTAHKDHDYIFINASKQTLINNKVIKATVIEVAYLKNILNADISANTLTITKGAIASENLGKIIVYKHFFNETTLTNKGALIISGTNNTLQLTPKLVNEATLGVMGKLELSADYHNSGLLLAASLDGKNHTITNSVAKQAEIKCDVLKDVTIQNSTLTLAKQVTGNVKINSDLVLGNYEKPEITPHDTSPNMQVLSNVLLQRISTKKVPDEVKTYIHGNIQKAKSQKVKSIKVLHHQESKEVNQYGNLTANNVYGKLSLNICGSMTVENIEFKHIENYGTFTVNQNLYGTKNSTINNKGIINGGTISNCTLINDKEARFKNINNANLTNNHKLTVTENISNEVTIFGGLNVGQSYLGVKQIGSCNVDFVVGGKLTTKGDMQVSKYIAVSRLINDASLHIGERLIIEKNHSLHNSGKITTNYISAKGQITNDYAGVINILQQKQVSFADHLFNHGNINIANDLLFNNTEKTITNQGVITANNLIIKDNCYFKNRGTLNLNSIDKTAFQQDKIANNGTIKVNGDIDLGSNFLNNGSIFANKISGSNMIYELTNKKHIAVKEINNISIINNGTIKVSDQISGEVNIKGKVLCDGNIIQSGNLVVNNIDCTPNSHKFTIDTNSETKISEIITNNINITNFGNLHLLSGSKIGAYYAHGGILYIWLPEDLAKISQPLLSIDKTADLQKQFNKRSIVVLKSKYFKNKIENNKIKLDILKVKNITLEQKHKKITDADLVNILGVQKMFDDSLGSSSIFLYISSPECITDNNETVIRADVSWKEITDINHLLSYPLILAELSATMSSKVNKVTGDSFFDELENNIILKKLPKETHLIAQKLAINTTIEKLKKLPVPDNSATDHKLANHIIAASNDPLDKRLAMDRSNSIYYRRSSGINSGSIYMDLYLWSSVTFNKNMGYKQKLYPRNTSTNIISNFGIDNQFTRKIKLGCMYANVFSSANYSFKNFNEKYDINSKYNIKTNIYSVYLNFDLGLWYFNIALPVGNIHYKQLYSSALFKNNTNYNVSIMGVNLNIIYPYRIRGYVIEFINIFKMNSILVPNYKLNEAETRYEKRLNIIHLGHGVNWNYSMLLANRIKLHTSCVATFLYSFSLPKRNTIDIKYYDNKFIMEQQNVNNYEVKVDFLLDLLFFSQLKFAMHLGYGIRTFSQYLESKIMIRYNF